MRSCQGLHAQVLVADNGLAATAGLDQIDEEVQKPEAFLAGLGVLQQLRELREQVSGTVLTQGLVALEHVNNDVPNA